MAHTIKARLWLGFAMVIALVCIGNAIAYCFSLSAAANIQTLLKGTVDKSVAERVGAEECRAQLMQARHEEKSFLLERNPNSVLAIDAAIASSTETLQNIQKIAQDPQVKQSAQDAAGQIGKYKAALHEVVELTTKKGLTLDTGLLGDLRTAAHDVEKIVNDQGLAELSVVMLSCRRHEKDYLLRGDEKYIEEISKCVAEFNKQMVAFSLPQDVQSKAADLWKKYVERMKAIAQIDKEIREKQSRMSDAAAGMEKAVAQIADAAAKDIGNVTSATSDVLYAIRIVIIWVAIATMVVGCLIAFVSSNSVTRPLRKIIAVLTASTGKVTLASKQVAQSSQSMAEGASVQASSLEETSASLEEIASMTRQNADNARQATAMADGASTAAESGQKVTLNMGEEISTRIKQLTDAIGQIKSSTDQTAKIIKTIDEIAFQTNLLALNAAVEAARAGDAGKGFAVVAEEVRNLAQRSADAARNTASLIEQSQANAANGVKVSSDVAQILKQAVEIEIAKNFQSAVEASSKVKHLIAEVASATDEQAKGIEQVNTAVAAMDKVTQGNAANAEESAAASEQLAFQARELSEMVEELIRITGGSKEFEVSGEETGVAGRLQRPAPRAVESDRRATPAAIVSSNRHALAACEVN